MISTNYIIPNENLGTYVSVHVLKKIQVYPFWVGSKLFYRGKNESFYFEPNWWHSIFASGRFYHDVYTSISVSSTNKNVLL